MMNWKNAVTVAVTPGVAAAPAVNPDAAIVLALLDASMLFDARTDAFAAGKGTICRDIAKRVNVSGFASEKQREYAMKLIEWAKPRAVMPANAEAILAQSQLRTAATRYEAVGNVRKSETCYDIANKLERFGSFASDAQKGFALVLVREAPGADPLPPEADGPLLTSAVPLPTNRLKVHKLFEVMQKHATLHAGDLKISRKNQDSMCWLIWGRLTVGKIDAGVATVWFGKAGSNFAAIMALLAEFEADPLAAAMKHGKASGRCCSCGRDLTDPASIEAGIGPICAEKF